jgi:ferric-dicitrate binding protein FerR (iron transport regulator)
MSNDHPRQPPGPREVEQHRPPPDPVERLISLADEGPPIPADGAEQIKASLRPLWRQQVRATIRRRRTVVAAVALAAAASAILAVTLVGTNQPQPVDPEPVASAAAVRGLLEILPAAGAPTRISEDDVGLVVTAGTWLRTDATSRAALDLEGGQSLRLDSNTRLRVETAEAMVLDRGAVYIDSGIDSRGAVEVRTTFGVARDIGTQFEVRREGGTLKVRVREGRVSLSRDGELLQLAQGTAVTVAADGSKETGGVLSHGQEWAWVQEVAPAFSIEGRSVVAFLDWVARETGLWVSFSDSEVERFAGTTLLHGSIAGLAPAEAPQVVLPGCGLEATRSGDTLLIGRPPVDGRRP